MAARFSFRRLCLFLFTILPKLGEIGLLCDLLFHVGGCTSTLVAVAVHSRLPSSSCVSTVVSLMGAYDSANRCLVASTIASFQCPTGWAGTSFMADIDCDLVVGRVWFSLFALLLIIAPWPLCVMLVIMLLASPLAVPPKQWRGTARSRAEPLLASGFLTSMLRRTYFHRLCYSWFR